MTRPPPPILPFLPDVQVGGPLQARPVKVAAWSAGSTRQVALACEDNTVWVTTSCVGPPGSLVPDLSLPEAYSSSSQPTGRPRATSSASSILSGSRRPFSPSSSTPRASLSLTSPTLTSVSDATAAPAPPDTHAHRNSVSDRADLRDYLREQVESDERSSLGLGLAGLTRRGIQVSSRDSSTRGDETPRSSASNTSKADSTGTGITHRLSGLWGKKEDDDLAAKTQWKKDEMAVEAEMAKEEAEDVKEKDDLAVIASRAGKEGGGKDSSSSSCPTPRRGDDAKPPVRVVLPNPERGTVIDVAVMEDVGCLVVLRDVGLLDIISLQTLDPVSATSLDFVSLDGKLPKLTHSWLWRGVHLAVREEGTLLIAHGEPWPSPWPSPNGDVTRVVMLNVPGYKCVATLELPGIGDVGVTSGGESSYLLHSSGESLTTYPINFPSSAPTTRSQTPVSPHDSPKQRSASGPASPSTSAGSSPYLRPDGQRRPGALASVRATSARHELGLAKLLGNKKVAEKDNVNSVHEQPTAGLEAGVEVQRDGGSLWDRILLHENGQGLGLTDTHVEAFDFDGKKLHVRGEIVLDEEAAKISDAVFTSGWHDVCIVTEADTQVYSRMGPLQPNLKWTPRRTFPADAACISSGTLYATEANAVINVDLGTMERKTEQRLVQPTAGDNLCPYGPSIVFVADNDGCVASQTLSDFLQEKVPVHEETDNDRFPSPVTFSCVIPSQYAEGGHLFVAGDADGSIRLFDASPLKPRGTWTLFDDPVRSATLIDPCSEKAGKLAGKLLCTSQRGTVAVLDLKEMDDMFVIPAARAPMTRIFVGGHSILLAYENAKARVWNFETGEFRRSTGLDAADDMLNVGDWVEVRFYDPPAIDCPLTKVNGPTPLGSNLGRLLQLDLRQLATWLNAHPNDVDPLDVCRGLLSVFLTFGINQGIDEVCENNLGIKPPKQAVAVGLEGQHGTSILSYANSLAAWRISGTATGLRQLAIVTLLRPFMESPAYEDSAADVVAYYSACLPEDTVEAGIDLFAGYYLDTAVDVHQSARMLFGARLSRMPNEDIEKLVEARQDQLPTRVPADQAMSEASAQALTVVGGIAIHRFACMNPAALKDAASSIELYLTDPKYTHVGLAIELCSKGFTTWQTYLDPMDLLRRLFYLATHKDSSLPNAASVAAQARLAVLNVASSNAPLFMSTLSQDIMDAKTVDDRTAVMKLCVFMARRRPALLENGLPRICEAVVKSLDPNIGKMRDDVWQAATVILNELVSAFTTVDFCAHTQRLAVGTNEGAVIMYDLKTASRLYVLEPHHKAVSAVSFAPDGRRLVTVSLEESDATVWKVGSSISGFFNVGGPPRQGGKPGEPYRRIPFVRADDEPLGDVGALSEVRVSWLANRQARVSIGATTLTFETT